MLLGLKIVEKAMNFPPVRTLATRGPISVSLRNRVVGVVSGLWDRRIFRALCPKGGRGHSKSAIIPISADRLSSGRSRRNTLDDQIKQKSPLDIVDKYGNVAKPHEE
jgi:hypothetical protein